MPYYRIDEVEESEVGHFQPHLRLDFSSFTLQYTLEYIIRRPTHWIERISVSDGDRDG